MKIIQGKYKGTILKGFDIAGTRPTMDRVKESLFAMIQNDITDSIVLDLFAGSGNLGIEALSMNAKDSIFVDNNTVAIKTIKENLNKINENRQVLKMRYEEALKCFFENNVKFDIIFLDPPYNTDYIEKSTNLITKYQLLKQNGLIVCETDDIVKIKYPAIYHEIKNKQYGQKTVVILKN